MDNEVRFDPKGDPLLTSNMRLESLLLRLIRAIEEAEHKPNQWAQAEQSMGGICTFREPSESSFNADSKPEERWAGFEYKRDAWLAVQAVRALPELMAFSRQSVNSAQALREIIDMNRQHAEDQYGDAEKAESWACVRVARKALSATARN